jgi:hypothetical protein
MHKVLNLHKISVLREFVKEILSGLLVPHRARIARTEPALIQQTGKGPLAVEFRQWRRGTGVKQQR